MSVVVFTIFICALLGLLKLDTAQTGLHNPPPWQALLRQPSLPQEATAPSLQVLRAKPWFVPASSVVTPSPVRQQILSVLPSQ